LLMVLMGLTALSLPGLADAQPARTEPDQAAEFRLAHQQAKSGQCTIHYADTQRNGIWTLTQSAELTLAFDRDARRLRYSHPDYELLIENDTFYLASERFPGRHIEKPYTGSMTYIPMLQELNELHHPPIHPLILVYAEKPWSWIAGSPTPTVVSHGPALQVATMDGVATLIPDDQKRLSKSTWLSAQTLADGSDAAGENKQVIDWHFFNEPMPEEVFELDLTDSVAVGSLAELFAGGVGAGSGGGAQPMSGEKIEGLKLLDMEGDLVDAALLEEGTVALVFWATWADPSIDELKRLKKVDDWVNEEKRTGSARVFAVNLEDEPADIQAFEQRFETGAPIVRDPDGSAAEKLGVAGVPHLIVLHDGVVQLNAMGPIEKLDTELIELMEQLSQAQEADLESPEDLDTDQPDKEAP